MLYTVENTVEVGRPVRVFLDGMEIDNVFEADTESGYVEIAKLNGSGRFFLDGDGEVASEKLFGKVSVEPMT